MSEYIDLSTEYDDERPDWVRLITNLDLAPDGAETYPDRAAGNEGSPLAQTLFEIEGIAALEIRGSAMYVQRTPDIEWYALVDEITTALKQFFL